MILRPAAREDIRKMTMTKVAIVAALAMHCVTASANDGLVTKPSKYSVKERIDNFEAAINAQAAGGWVAFDRIDHAAAAKKTPDSTCGRGQSSYSATQKRARS